MAILSAFTIIRTISLFHLTAAYFFLTAPRVISDQNVVYMMGEAVALPHATSLQKPSEGSAFIAILLAFVGLSDLTAASMFETTALEYWLSVVPIRLVFLFFLTGYVYLFKEGGALGASSGSFAEASVGEPLQNSLVFAFGFIEVAMWFWVFNTLRDERREMVRKRIEKLKMEEDRLRD